MIANKVFADSSSSLNLQLPNSVSNYQSDKFRDGDLDCSNAIGSATNLEFGVTGIIDGNSSTSTFDMDQSTDIGVFAKITIPLGRRVKQRIDCNRLFELAIRQKQLEVMRLEAELRKLQELTFEN
jgi:2-iminoacetate synthase ThiH